MISGSSGNLKKKSGQRPVQTTNAARDEPDVGIRLDAHFCTEIVSGTTLSLCNEYRVREDLERKDWPEPEVARVERL